MAGRELHSLKKDTNALATAPWRQHERWHATVKCRHQRNEVQQSVHPTSQQPSLHVFRGQAWCRALWGLEVERPTLCHIMREESSCTHINNKRPS